MEQRAAAAEAGYVAVAAASTAAATTTVIGAAGGEGGQPRMPRARPAAGRGRASGTPAMGGEHSTALVFHLEGRFSIAEHLQVILNFISVVLCQ